MGGNSIGVGGGGDGDVKSAQAAIIVVKFCFDICLVKRLVIKTTSSKQVTALLHKVSQRSGKRWQNVDLLGDVTIKNLIYKFTAKIKILNIRVSIVHYVQ